jgi:hypothetical protein
MWAMIAADAIERDMKISAEIAPAVQVFGGHDATAYCVHRLSRN